MSTSNATQKSTPNPVHSQRTHRCRKCKDATLHSYAHPKAVRTALHYVKIAGSLCTLGMAFPHEFSMPEVPGRCTKCGTASTLPYA